MYKLIACWSTPKPEDREAFEAHYLGVHVPKAEAVPELRRLVLTRAEAGLEGNPPAFYRTAEMFYDDPEALARSAESPAFKDVRADAGELVERFGVTLDVGIGWEQTPPLPVGTSLDRPSVDRLLSTTRAVRKRLDLTRPVERSLILECIRLSQQAPTGSNRQGWRWMVVTDAEKRAKLADIYRRGGAEYLEQALAETQEGDIQTRRVYESALYLVEHLAEVPVHVIPCVMGRVPDDAPNGMKAGLWGSIFPAVWSFQLALRSRGLGSVLTTLHLNNEEEAARLLGIPETVTQVGLLPVAHTKGGDFKPASRPPAEDITHWDRWQD